MAIPTNQFETLEEQKRRIERENLAKMQASISIPITSEDIPISKEEPIKELISRYSSEKEVEVSPETLELISRYSSEKEKEPIKEEVEVSPETLELISRYSSESPVSSPEISLAREIAYGQAQERTALGSAYSLMKSAYEAFLDPNETYKEARSRNESQRQEKILEEFAEFRGREETAGVLTGRATIALIDPVTFIIPWAKFAKMGKIASLGAGGTFAAADMALREEALYGEINPYVVGMGFGLGVAGSQVGDMFMAAYNKKASASLNETVQVRNKAGEPVGKPVIISGSADAPIIKPANLPKAEKLVKELILDSEEALANMGTLNARLDKISTRRLEISAQLKKIKSERKKVLTKKEIAEDDYFMFIEKGATGERKKLTAEVKVLNQELKKIFTEEMPDNLLDVLNKSFIKGQKSGLMSEGIAKSIIHETVRPLMGGIIGGGIGATFTEEGDSNATMLYMAAMGATLGKFQKVIQTAPYKIIPKKIRDAAGNEFVKEYRRSFYNYMKGLTAASHSQELMAFSKPVVTFSSKMYNTPGGGIKLGSRVKEAPVEQATILQQGYWRNLYSDLISKYDDDVLELAGKFTNNRNLKSKKYSFLSKEDLASPKLAQAEKLSLEIDEFTLKFRNYAVSRGLTFDDEAQYGLTQLLKQEAIKPSNYEKVVDELGHAFFIQNSKEVGHKFYKPIGKEIAAAKAHAKNTAGEYLQTSTTLRAQSIWKKETDEAIFQSNNIGKARDEEFILDAARHFNKARTLYDQEARASVSHLFEQNPKETLRQLINNTVYIAEFAKRFGAKGQGIKKLFKDIDDEIKAIADPTNKYRTARQLYIDNPPARARAQAEKKKIKDSLEAWFGVYHIDKMPTSNLGQGIVTFLQAGLATTRLFKVAIPSLGDFLQIITNSGYRAAYKGAISEIKLSKEALGLKGTQKQVGGKDATFMDKFLGNNRTDTILSRELSDVLLVGGGNIKRYQHRVADLTRKYFEVIQLGRVTRLARNWAFDSGVARAMDMSQLVAKGRTGFLKTKEAFRKEMDSMGLGRQEFKYLSQFDTLEKAIADPVAKTYLKKAGIKATDRDALIPQVGNRRLFSQSKDPYVKFLGSFLSWAQAKTSQLNALIARVEQGDTALFLRMVAAIPLYMAVREAQVDISTNKNYKEEVAEETLVEKIGEGIGFAGWNTFLVEKARGIIKFDSFGSDTMEQLAPVLGYMEDFADIIIKPVSKMLDSEADTALEKLKEVGLSLVKETAEALPLARELVPLAEQKDEEYLMPSFAKGGKVINVPNVKEEPDELKIRGVSDTYSGIAGTAFQDEEERSALQDGGGVEIEEEDPLIEIVKNSLREKEGLSLEAYKPVPTEKYFTIGFGHYGPDVKEGQVIDEAQAEEYLDTDVRVRIEEARKLIQPFDQFPLETKEAIMVEYFRGSIRQSPNTIKLINQGKYAEAAEEYLDNDEYRRAEELKKPGIRPRMERVAEALRSLKRAVKKGGLVSALQRRQGL